MMHDDPSVQIDENQSRPDSSTEGRRSLMIVTVERTGISTPPDGVRKPMAGHRDRRRNWEKLEELALAGCSRWTGMSEEERLGVVSASASRRNFVESGQESGPLLLHRRGRGRTWI